MLKCFHLSLWPCQGLCHAPQVWSFFCNFMTVTGDTTVSILTFCHWLSLHFRGQELEVMSLLSANEKRPYKRQVKTSPNPYSNPEIILTTRSAAAGMVPPLITIIHQLKTIPGRIIKIIPAFEERSLSLKSLNNEKHSSS